MRTYFLATIACSGEDNGTMESMTPIIENVFKENKDLMADELPKTLALRSEVYHKISLEFLPTPAHAPYRVAPAELEK